MSGPSGLFVEHRDEYPSEWAAMTSIADQARHDGRDPCARGSVGPRSTRAGVPGSPPTSARRLKELEKENRELRRANEILKDASIFFATELDGRTEEVVRYIDARKGRWGVEPICRALQFAPATYYAAKCRPP